MTLLLAVKILGIWVFLALIAIINGAVRDKLLVSLIGQRLALPLSGVSLSLLIFLVTLIFAPFLAISSPYGFWQVGIIWVLLTLAFEFLFGHYVVGEPWEKIVEVFYVHRGNLYVLALVAAALSPYLAAKIWGII
jgi:hypothetical protein